MKYKIAELNNRLSKNNTFEEVISFKNKINEEIVDIDDCLVKGYFDYDKRSETYRFHMHISTNITALCVISLEPVKVLVDFDTDLFYTFKVADDDSFPIIGNIIELDEEIWGEIILQMPLRVVKEGITYDEEEEVKLEKENPFSQLCEIEGEE